MSLAEAPYAISRTTSLSYEEADRRIRETLQAEGFGVLTEIDVRATLQRKLGVEIEPYEILGACNPALASRALAAEHSVGLLLPCNVVVRTSDGRTFVEALDPIVQLQLADNAALQELAVEAHERIRRAVDAVG